MKWSIEHDLAVSLDSVTSRQLRQTRTEPGQGVHRPELDLTQRRVAESPSHEPKKLGCYPRMLIEQLHELGVRDDVHLDVVEGDDSRRSCTSVDCAELAEQCSRIEHRQDDFSPGSLSANFYATGTKDEDIVSHVALAEENRTALKVLAVASVLEVRRFVAGQTAKKVTLVALCFTGRLNVIGFRAVLWYHGFTSLRQQARSTSAQFLPR